MCTMPRDVALTVHSANHRVTSVMPPCRHLLVVNGGLGRDLQIFTMIRNYATLTVARSGTTKERQLKADHATYHSPDPFARRMAEQLQHFNRHAETAKPRSADRFQYTCGKIAQTLYANDSNDGHPAKQLRHSCLWNCQSYTTVIIPEHYTHAKLTPQLSSETQHGTITKKFLHGLI
jgi:hypothetical protein